MSRIGGLLARDTRIAMLLREADGDTPTARRPPSLSQAAVDAYFEQQLARN